VLTVLRCQGTGEKKEAGLAAASYGITACRLGSPNLPATVNQIENDQNSAYDHYRVKNRRCYLKRENTKQPKDNKDYPYDQ